MDQVLAGLIIDEIRKDAEQGVPAEYFFSYDEHCPGEPLAAAEVLTLTDGSLYIAYLTCHPSHMGRGHGSALLTKILSIYQGQTVLTHPCEGSIRFYKKHGFERLDNRTFGIKAAA